MPRRRLEAHRGQLGGTASLAVWCHRSLQRAQLHIDSSLGEELPCDYGITGSLAVEQRRRELALLVAQAPCSWPLLQPRLCAAEVPPGGHTLIPSVAAMRFDLQLIAANPRICRTISGSNIGTSVARSATPICLWSIDPSWSGGVTFSVVWGALHVSPDRRVGRGPLE